MELVSLVEEATVAGLSFLRELLALYGPKVLIAFGVLVAGWIVGRVLALLVERIVSRGGLGSAFKGTSVGRAILVSGYTPARFFSNLAKWSVYIVTVYEVIEILAIPALRTLMREIVLYMPRFISGLAIFVVGSIFSDTVGNVARQAGGGSGKIGYYNPFGDIIRIFLYFITLVMTLTQMGIDVTILHIFAQAFAWAISIAVAIALGWNLKDRIGPWIDQMFPQQKEEKQRKLARRQ